MDHEETKRLARVLGSALHAAGKRGLVALPDMGPGWSGTNRRPIRVTTAGPGALHVLTLVPDDWSDVERNQLHRQIEAVLLMAVALGARVEVATPGPTTVGIGQTKTYALL